MTSIWVESLGRSFEDALGMLAAAVNDCSGELWETTMWDVPRPGPEHQFLAPDWSPITDDAQREALGEQWVRRRATPWSVAWHALEVFDYDLNGDFGPWASPPPFAGHPHWRDLPSLPSPWSQSDVLGYVDYCRQRAREVLAEMTDERAANPLPPTHRYGGQPYARIITGILVHTTEHASQIRQFITGAGMEPTAG